MSSTESVKKSVFVHLTNGQTVVIDCSNDDDQVIGQAMEVIGNEEGFIRGPKIGGGFVTIPARHVLFCVAYGLDDLSDRNS